MIYLNRFLPLIIFSLLSILRFDLKVWDDNDSVAYMNLAKSIVEYHNYLSIYIKEMPPHIHFPPGFPLLLAPLYAVFGINELALKMLPLISNIIAFFILTLLIRNFYILLVLSTSPLLISHSSKLLSEGHYLMFSLLSIYLFINRRYLSSSIFSGFSYLIRTSGISLIGSFLLYLLLKRNFKAFLMFLIISLIFILPWQIWTFIHENPYEVNFYPPYFEQLISKVQLRPEFGYISIYDFALRPLKNFINYWFVLIPKSIFNVKIGLGLFIVGILLFIGFVYGFLKEKNEEYSIIKLYTILYFALMFMWPEEWKYSRFVIPVLPFVVYFSFISLKHINEKVFKFVCIFVFAFNFIVNLRYAPLRMKEFATYMKGDIYLLYEPSFSNYLKAIHYIQKNIPKDKSVVSRIPHTVYLISGNRGGTRKFSNNTDSIILYLKNYDYVLVAPSLSELDKKYLFKPILKNAQHFKLIYQTEEPKVYLFEVVK